MMADSKQKGKHIFLATRGIYFKMFTERGHMLFDDVNTSRSKYWGILKSQYRFSYALTFCNAVTVYIPHELWT